MPKHVYWKVITIALLASVLLAGPVLAQTEPPPDPPQSIPNGPWIQPNQEVKYERLMSNEELYDKLFEIEARSKGRMQVELAGYSGGGYPIYVVKFGEADPGKTRIMVESQIHGGEPLGTKSIVNMMQHLATSSNKDVLDILKKETIWFIPRLNPDGAAHTVDGELRPRRQNHLTWNPLEWGLPPPYASSLVLLLPDRPARLRYQPRLLARPGFRPGT